MRFQSSLPFFGLSVQYDLSDQLVAQGILGAFGTVTNIGGRGLYRFTRERTYDLFGYGALGVWRWEGARDFGGERTVRIGTGAGVEFDWRQILTPDDLSFPPLFGAIEIGVTSARFDNYAGFSTLMLGGAVHYRF